MNKILVTYASMAGSTAEVAQAIAEEIGKGGNQVEVLPIEQVKSLRDYAGVVVGAPMIMGWHRGALGFLRKNRSAWQHLPLAIFVTAMSLTQSGESEVDGQAIFVDPNLPKPPINEDSLSFKERYARLSNYLRPVLKAVRPAKPVSVGVFAGRMEYGRLKWWAVLFAMIIIQAQAGDRRNWEAMREWAGKLPPLFTG
jgi:menaquinone-dependent protoporphyrinogen oxidase